MTLQSVLVKHACTQSKPWCIQDISFICVTGKYIGSCNFDTRSNARAFAIDSKTCIVKHKLVIIIFPYHLIRKEVQAYLSRIVGMK